MPQAITGVPYSDNLGLIQSLVNKRKLRLINGTQEYNNYDCVKFFRGGSDLESGGEYGGSTRETVRGGDLITERIDLSPDGAADWLSPMEEVDYSVDDRVFTLTSPWSILHKSWAVGDEETSVNRDDPNFAAKLYDIVTTRRWPAVKALARSIEDGVWGAGFDAGGTRFLRGVPYSILKADNGATTDGFKGRTIRYANGTTGTVWFGLDRAQHALAQNYVCVYQDMSNYEDVSRKLQRMMLELHFRPPIGGDGMVRPYSEDYRAFTGKTVLVELTAAARAGGDAFGFALDGSHQLSFGRMTFSDVVPLESDPHRPIYIINRSRWKFFVRDGWWMREYSSRDSRRPTVLLNSIYCSIQMMPDNPRHAGAVMHTPI